MPLAFSLDQQRVAFHQHLDEPRNERIIFSGAFGIGKTFFLDDYFTHHAAEYVAVKLSPVNYSVSAGLPSTATLHRATPNLLRLPHCSNRYESE